MKNNQETKFKDVVQLISRELDQFEEIYRNFLSSNIGLARSIIDYLNVQNGKKIRPVITILSAKLCGDEINKKTVHAAIMCEILHTASLLHDDVVDSSDTRRGAPTIHQIWKNKTSILMGDYLFSKVLESGVNFGGEKIFNLLYKITKEMIGSEIKQIEFSSDTDIGVDDYFDLINGKTASLFSMCSELGSVSVTRDKKKHQKMKNFGKNFGMAF